MTADSAKILAGVGDTSRVGSLAFFGPADTAGPIAVTYTAEVQTATITGTPTGGTFTLTWQGIAAPAQAYNVATSALATALNTAWSTKLHGGVIAVSGSAGSSYVLTFPATLGNVPTVTSAGAFTGGTNPAIAVVESTPGAGATPATAVIPTGFSDAGFCTTDGLSVGVNETVNSVKAFGTTAVVRTIIQDSAKTFGVNFLETNLVTQAIYNRLAIGAVTADSNGAFSYVSGPPQTQTYAGIFNMVDGSNALRAYAPRLQVSSVKGVNVAAGKEITWPVEFTPLPDLSGNSVYWYVAVDALHA